MWIRSQDKKILLKAKEIRIEIEKKKEYILEKELPNYKPEDVFKEEETDIYYNCVFVRYYLYKLIGYIVVNDTRIARYSTEEKAIKVLDMIQEYINSGGRMFVTDQTKTDFGMSAVYEKKLGVFQMPTDEKVKGGEKGDQESKRD